MPFFLTMPDQHEQAEHRVKIHRRVEQDQRQHAERNGDRQRHQDRDRLHPAFELGGQDQVHECDRQGKRDQEVIAGFTQRFGLAGEDVAVLRRQIHLLQDPLGASDRLAQRDALRGCRRP